MLFARLDHNLLLMNAKVKERRGRTNHSRVSAKHQVTIPVDALRKAGLEAGDRVRFEVEAPGVVRLVRERSAEIDAKIAALEMLADSIPGYSAQTDLEAMRDQWEDTEGRPWLEKVYSNRDRGTQR